MMFPHLLKTRAAALPALLGCGLPLIAPGASHAASAVADTPASRPNILFIILDDWGWRDAGAYGSTWVRTPAFDRIAREGVLFQNAFTANPKCSPSRASILTGRNPWQNGPGHVHYSHFPSGLPIYTAVLEQAGYAIGHTGKGWAPGDFAAAGFDRNPAGKPFNNATLTPPARNISRTDYAENFSHFLSQRQPGQPFCFWLGAREPHRPYEQGSAVRAGRSPDEVTVPPWLPDNPVVRGDLLDYAFEVEWADSHAAKALAILEAAGELENTLVVMTSDNGMPFPGAKGQINEAGCHLPLAMRWGGNIKPGRVVEDFVSMRDLAPTFLAAAGLPASATMTGRNLLPLLRSYRSGWIDRDASVMLLGRERHDLGRPRDTGYPVRAIRTTEWLYARNYAPERWPTGNPETNYTDCDDSPTKTIVTGRRDAFFDAIFGLRPEEMLYHLENDPACLRNVADNPRHAATKRALLGQMEAALREEGDPRMSGLGEIFDTYPYLGARRASYETWLREQLGLSEADPAAGFGRAPLENRNQSQDIFLPGAARVAPR